MRLAAVSYVDRTGKGRINCTLIWVFPIIISSLTLLNYCPCQTWRSYADIISSWWGIIDRYSWLITCYLCRLIAVICNPTGVHTWLKDKQQEKKTLLIHYLKLQSRDISFIHTILLFAHSFWNFAQITAVSLPCSVQNIKTIGQLRNMNDGPTRIREIWVLDAIWMDILYCNRLQVPINRLIWSGKTWFL